MSAPHRIIGGKWTTHRAMAEDTIDVVEKTLGRVAGDCPTHHHVLYGSEDWTTGYWQKLVNTYKIAPDLAHHLSAKFGTAAGNILDLVKVDASLGERIISEHPMIRAEVVYAVREELAATVEDVLARRVGVQFYSWRSAREALLWSAPSSARNLAGTITKSNPPATPTSRTSIDFSTSPVFSERLPQSLSCNRERSPSHVRLSWRYRSRHYQHSLHRVRPLRPHFGRRAERARTDFSEAWLG